MARTTAVTGGSQRALRTANQRRIIDELSRRGELTQAEIARSTGLAASTVSNIVGELADQQLIERKENRGGPHGQLIGLIPPAGLALGIEVGHRHLTIALSSLAHDIVAERRIELQHGHRWDEDLATLQTLLDEVCAEAAINREDILVAGLALPAPIDLDGRRITSRDVMPGWADIDVKERAEAALGVPVFVDNDANLGAIGEQIWGAAQGVDDLAYLKLSGGIGAGLVLSGSLYRGADGSAGEVGHTTIDEDGAVCRCGNRGCLETLASVPAILALLRPVMGEDVTIDEVIHAAHAGNAACIRVLEDAGQVIGLALANLANTVNPSVIVIGGSLAEAGEIIIDPIRRTVSRYAVRGVVQRLEFRVSSLGVRSHVLGAVSLALEHAPAF